MVTDLSTFAHSPYIIENDGETFFSGDKLIPPAVMSVWNHLWFDIFKNDWLKKSLCEKSGVIEGIKIYQASLTDANDTTIQVTVGRFIIEYADTTQTSSAEKTSIIFDLKQNKSVFREDDGTAVAEEFSCTEEGWHFFWVQGNTDDFSAEVIHRHLTSENIFDLASTKKEKLDFITSDLAILIGYVVVTSNSGIRVKSFHSKGSSLGLLSNLGAKETPALRFNYSDDHNLGNATGIYSNEQEGQRGMNVVCKGEDVLTVRSTGSNRPSSVGIGITRPLKTLHVYIDETKTETDGLSLTKGNEKIGVSIIPKGPARNENTLSLKRGGGGYIRFTDDEAANYGFSLGYYGNNTIDSYSNVEMFDWWPANNFIIARYDNNQDGTVAFTIKETAPGYAGFNTDDPLAQLHVVGESVAFTNTKIAKNTDGSSNENKGLFFIPNSNTNGSGRIHFKESADGKGFLIGSALSNSVLSPIGLTNWPTETFCIYTYDGGNTEDDEKIALSINKHQQIGIGTAFPSTSELNPKLHIAGNLAITTDKVDSEGIFLIPHGFKSGGGNSGGRILFKNSGIQGFTEGFSVGSYADSDADGEPILNWPQNTFIIASHPNEAEDEKGIVRFSIKHVDSKEAYVGIGTDDPLENFHIVKKDGEPTLLINAGGSQRDGILFKSFRNNNETSNILSFKGNSTTELNEHGFSMAFNYGGAANLPEAAKPLDGYNSDTPINLFSIIRHNGSATGDTAFSIKKENGYVGINTNNPQTSLHIVGDNISMTNNPDSINGVDQDQGIFFLPYYADNNSGGRIFFKEQTSNDHGFSLGYNGHNSGSILNWNAETFVIARHNNNETGLGALSIQKNTGYVGINTVNPQIYLHTVGDACFTATSAFDINNDITTIPLSYQTGIFIIPQMPVVNNGYDQDAGGRILFNATNEDNCHHGISLGYNGSSEKETKILDWPKNTFIIATHNGLWDHDEDSDTDLIPKDHTALSIHKETNFVGIHTNTADRPLHINGDTQITDDLFVGKSLRIKSNNLYPFDDILPDNYDNVSMQVSGNAYFTPTVTDLEDYKNEYQTGIIIRPQALYSNPDFDETELIPTASEYFGGGTILFKDSQGLQQESGFTLGYQVGDLSKRDPDDPSETITYFGKLFKIQAHDGMENGNKVMFSVTKDNEKFNLSTGLLNNNTGNDGSVTNYVGIHTQEPLQRFHVAENSYFAKPVGIGPIDDSLDSENRKKPLYTEDYYLYVKGKVKVTEQIESPTFLSISDARLKTNFQEISDALNIICNLKGLSFNWDYENQNHHNQTLPQAKSLGLIAQEVEKILPEAVNTNQNGYKSIAYNNLIAVLIESVKELTQRLKKIENNIY